MPPPHQHAVVSLLEDCLREECDLHDPELICSASSGYIFRCVNYAEEQVAAKCVLLPHFLKEYKRESSMLTALHHPSIIPLLGSYSNTTVGVLILKCAHHDLIDVLQAHSLSVLHSANIFHQICEAVQFIHNQGIAHLDIKPENILLDVTQEHAYLADFGIARYFTPGHQFAGKRVGTFLYCAPEILHEEPYYPVQADIWSLGIVLHVILTGTWPYSGHTETEIYQAVQNGEVVIDVAHLTDLSYDLLRSILCLDPNNRLSLEEILKHPWFDEAAGRHKSSSMPSLSPRNRQNVSLNHFRTSHVSIATEWIYEALRNSSEELGLSAPRTPTRVVDSL